MGKRGLPDTPDQSVLYREYLNGRIYCRSCKKFYQESKFGKSKGSHNYGYKYYCLQCRKAKARKNGELEYHKEKIKRKYRDGKSYWVELFGGACVRCGFSDGIWALEFHHVYPVQKEYAPSSLVYIDDKERVLKELDKCILLCSNCHKTYKKTWVAEFAKVKYGYVILDEYMADSEKTKKNHYTMSLFTEQEHDGNTSPL